MPSLAEFRRPVPPFPIISQRRDAQEHYVECRRNGTSHRLAEMFALQQFPGVETDDTFIAGHQRQFDRSAPLYRDRVLAEARAAGVNTERAVYKSQLARYPGDPEAWVSSKDDVLRVAERRGLTLEGGITYTPPERDFTPVDDGPYRVAEDIVQDKFEEIAADRPEVAAVPGFKDQLRETLSGG